MLLLDKNHINPILDDGQPVPSGDILFPYFDSESKLVGLKYRDFYAELQFNRQKRDTIMAEGTLTLFGLDQLNFDLEDVVIWEGEPDCLLAYELDKSRNHLGIPGTQFAKRVAENLHLLRRFRRIYIALDDDTAGEECRAAIEEILPTYLVWHVRYNVLGVNDLGDLGHSYEDYDELMDSAVQKRNTNLISGNDLALSTQEYFAEEQKYNFLTTGYSCIDKMLGGGLSTGEVLGLVSHTGRGKSTLCANIAYNLCEQNVPVMWIGTEMQFTQMMRKFIERHCARRLVKHDHRWSLSSDEINNAIQYLSERIVFFNDMSIDYDSVEESVIDAIYRYKIRVLFIDVLNDIDPEFGVWRRTSEIMHRLNSLTAGSFKDKRHPISTVCVCHTKAVDGHYSDEIDVSDIGGGVAVHKNLTTIIAMNGSINSPDRKLELLKKSRMNDSDASEGTLFFDISKRRYFEIQIGNRTSSARNTGKQLEIRGRKTNHSDNGANSTRFLPPRNRDVDRSKRSTSSRRQTKSTDDAR